MPGVCGGSGMNHLVLPPPLGSPEPPASWALVPGTQPVHAGASESTPVAPRDPEGPRAASLSHSEASPRWVGRVLAGRASR